MGEATSNSIVILNLFQDSRRRLLVVLKQVQHDEGWSWGNYGVIATPARLSASSSNSSSTDPCATLSRPIITSSGTASGHRQRRQDEPPLPAVGGASGMRAAYTHTRMWPHSQHCAHVCVCARVCCVCVLTVCVCVCVCVCLCC